MSRDSSDPIAVGRRLVLRGRMVYVLNFLRVLSCLPSGLAVLRYLGSAKECVQNSRISFAYCTKDTLLPGLWCLISGYMTYLSLDSMMVRWMVTYSQPAAIIRALACVSVNFLLIHALTRFYGTPIIHLQIWILISVMSTGLYIMNSFVVSNIHRNGRSRTLNLFRISVYAVIPIGMASFITMIFLIRIVMLMEYHQQLGYRAYDTQSIYSAR